MTDTSYWIELQIRIGPLNSQFQANSVAKDIAKGLSDLGEIKIDIKTEK